MSLPGPAKVLFDIGLRSSRVPIDLAFQVAGRRDSQMELLVDRLEAGVRSAAGVLFDDAELSAQGERGLAAAREREKAAGLRGGDAGIGRDAARSRGL